MHVVLVVVHLKGGFRRLDHAPHDHRGDLDRIAFGVVHLQMRALEVPHPERDPLACVERIRPSQTGSLRAPRVVAKELQHLRFVRIDDEEPPQCEHPQGHGDGSADEANGRAWLAGIG